ncbi:cellulose binding domain-containing protein [Actinacidiphila paucisporea]|uniref:Mannan endo-1,4-beta-mannosidase/cellulose 1,4-beta-cellobiosidase n=1 Tax=Actinacidiphila paucisporea TaxID=310782 RepID=A0A1M6ZBT0_9ACTN|nr:cellulose binding domain-containing protein [Actinacidiphila paucisporea]SHL27942.1 mannan endo-1,4-beta-mannosidase/cellulose 1,4-beta-cellobiosidase [Actinacidiphila paucisporea]
MHIDTQWGTGLVATVTVTAGASPLTGWTDRWSWPGTQTVTSSWNATVSQSGAAVTAKNLSYNGSLAASAATTFGFQAAASGSFSVPSLSCTPN